MSLSNVSRKSSGKIAFYSTPPGQVNTLMFALSCYHLCPRPELFAGAGESEAASNTCAENHDQAHLPRKLTLEIPILLCNWTIEGNGEPFADLEYMLKNTQRVTGVLHRWVEAESLFQVAVHWNAGNNETLAWTTGKLWRSIK
jgi:hypothetical protein